MNLWSACQTMQASKSICSSVHKIFTYFELFIVVNSHGKNSLCMTMLLFVVFSSKLVWLIAHPNVIFTPWTD
jgi:hypothetical protein